MVFKRKKKLTIYKNLKSLFFPERGWRRAIEYISHRIRRLPDTPPRMALGLSFGVFASFSPLFGVHFLLGAFLAYLFNANVFASILGTFFGNPITFPVIAAVSVRTGSFIIDRISIIENEQSISDNWEFNSEFTSLSVFEKFLVEVYFEKFIPYSIGGTICGIIAALTVYLLSKPLISSYQKRKKRKKNNAKL